MTKKINKLLNWVLLIIGVLYLTNFTFGFVEILPDNIPFVGNIDEGIAGALIYTSWKALFGK